MLTLADVGEGGDKNDPQEIVPPFVALSDLYIHFFHIIPYEEINSGVQRLEL